ncbi:MAG: sigma 54-interacting transcriptional regulator [Planctomycetota bacterium]
MNARLWIREPSGRIHEFSLVSVPLGGTGVVIGRDAEADITLADPAVSRRHARLQLTHEGWRLVDLGSSNQTFVNGDPIQSWLLQPGDLVGIGDCEIHLVEEVARVQDNSSQTQVLRRLGGSPAPEDSRAATVLALLHQLSRDLPGLQEENTLLEHGVRVLVEQLEAGRGAALLFEGETLLCRAAHSRLGQAMRGFVLSQTIFQEVLQTREAVLSRDTSSDARFHARESILGEEIRSVIAAPIRGGDRILGILYLDRVELDAPFQSEDLYGAAVAAEVLGSALSALGTRNVLVGERENLVRTIVESLPIIGTSPGIQRVRDFIRRAAPADSTVLILGETGTGKELVAQAIHYQSTRRGHPFIAINCAAIPESLVESELFGHEKGAFTGAHERRIGKFEAAHQGTVFLDEVGELPLSCQGKLLRLLEEKCFERVGSTQSQHIDVRVLAATNRDLTEEMERKNFREDLFYRLNVLQVTLPSLAARHEDLPLLIDHFLDHYAQKTRSPRKRLSAEAKAHLLQYSWPGNVRQLRNVIESCVVMARTDGIELEDLPSTLGPRRSTTATPDATWVPRSLQEVEREHILRVLQSVEWNKSRAAEILGIERSTLYARIKSHQLEPGKGA